MALRSGRVGDFQTDFFMLPPVPLGYTRIFVNIGTGEIPNDAPMSDAVWGLKRFVTR